MEHRRNAVDDDLVPRPPARPHTISSERLEVLWRPQAARGDGFVCILTYQTAGFDNAEPSLPLAVGIIARENRSFSMNNPNTQNPKPGQQPGQGGQQGGQSGQERPGQQTQKPGQGGQHGGQGGQHGGSNPQR
jgi:hypothetical protein